MVRKNSICAVHRLSRIFQPITTIPKNAKIKRHDITSKSQKLMLDLGLIKQASPGCFHFLPLGMRSLDKLSKLVDDEMLQIGGQKVMLPSLTNAKLWEATGRLESVSSELFSLKDRHDQQYILSPTHEEAISELVASIGPVSYKHFPLKLYQITSKYRDEMKPRFGLMRGKQFTMKDMYSFDVDQEAASKTYEEVCNSYDRIFKKINVNYVKVLGSTGHIGGSISHEYHYKSEIGEDSVLSCANCGYSANVEISGEGECPKCSSKHIEVSPAIEVGHTFFLGEKYSKPLKANFIGKDTKPHVLQMGCYGLGLSRIIAAALEVLSMEHEMRWPRVLAPYTVLVIPPKSGSKEEIHLENLGYIEAFLSRLQGLEFLQNEILLDDRTSLTIGKRFMEAKMVGYPFIITLGQKSLQDPPLIELIDLGKDTQNYLNEDDLFKYLHQNVPLL